ncbi:type IV pilus modification protein PilV [Actimicrobium antarcticum]|uniref:Type IV pilus modification protein PilV n=1 Tax=Actimicrobium antarcticum TaxID=1051899 RepID=A0ABP7TUL9_9BURK
MNPDFPAKRRQAGMTLIEVLVSMLIFSFGFLGLIGMQARAVQVSMDSEDRSRAALLANDIVSAMWSQKTLSLSSTVVSDWQARVINQAASGLPGASGTVGAPDANGIVTVTITWRAPSRKSGEPDSQYITQVLMP